MRIHHLRFRAIGPFLAEQTVDFDNLAAAGIFLLEGPTGVGKSTIIDAIVFALYGRTAAKDGDDDRLVSHFRKPDGPEPFVEMVFSTGSGTYRVRRSPEHQRLKAHAKHEQDTTRQRATATLIRLADPADGDGDAIASKAPDVGAEIARIVGLNRDQFISTIVLPQGEFARFLGAKTATKQEILQNIFRTHLYERVQEDLRVTARAAEAACRTAEAAAASSLDTLRGAIGTAHAEGLEGLTGTSNADGVGATVDGIVARIRGEAAAAEAAHTAAVGIEAAARQELSAADSRIKLRDIVAQALAEKSELMVQTDAVAALVVALDGDARAGRVADVLDAADRTAADQVDAESALARTRADSPAAIAGLAEPQLQEYAAAARGTIGSLEELRIEEASLGQQRERHEEQLAQAARLADESSRLQEQRNALPDQIAATRARLGSLRITAAAQSGLAQNLLDWQERARAATSLEQARKRSGRADTGAAASLAASEDADSRAAEASRRYRAGIAAVIGAELRAGDPCPACGSTAHPAPAQPSDDHVSSQQLDEATEAASRARNALQSADQELVAARAAEAALDAVAKGATAATAAAEVARLRAEVEAARQAATAADALEEEIDASSAALDGLAKAVAMAQTQRAGIEATAAGTASAIARIEERAGRGRAGFGSVADRLIALQLEAARCDKLVDLHRRADDSARAAMRAAADAKSALEREGLPDRAAARAALMSAADRAGAESQVADHDRALTRVAATLDRDDLRGVDAAEVIDRGPAAAAAAAAAQQLAERSKDDATAAEALRNAEIRGRAVGAAFESRDRAQESHRTAIELGRWATGANALAMDLSTFVLVHRFGSVIEAANHHLLRMSNGRLMLESFDEAVGRAKKGGLGIRVMDLHTEVARSPGTLSGGETFYTSLSLALGLAEIVTSESGGVELDTLFVDEGFGSLDPDTLDTVMAVLDDLQRDGRVLGLVSHVTEMKDRIPERIEVRRTKATGPSELQVIA